MFDKIFRNFLLTTFFLVGAWNGWGDLETENAYASNIKLKENAPFQKGSNSAVQTNLSVASTESNDGSLPPSEYEPATLNERSKSAENWLDESLGPEIKKLALQIAKERRANWPKFSPVDETKMKSLGIRKIESGRVSLYTDMPKSTDVDVLPKALDSMIPLLCDFFHVDASAYEDWRVQAFLMHDFNAFIRLGVLDGPPLFLHGYSDRDRIFAKDHGESYYNRFLLAHELVHTFMHDLFGDLRPRWFSEGAAEYLALHKFASNGNLQIALIPEAEEDTPGFARLRIVKEAIQKNQAPTLLDILRFEPRDFVNDTTYAWSWALVMFLYNSPKYSAIAELLPYWMITADPNRLFVDAIGERWEEFENDWAAFLYDLDYGYDFESSTIVTSGEIQSGESLDFEKGVVVEVDPTKGWQGTAIELEKGKNYKLTVGGRFDFYLPIADRVMKFEGTGASVQYYNDCPVGRVQAVVVPTPQNKTFEETYGFAKIGEESKTPFYMLDRKRRTRFETEGLEKGTNRQVAEDSRAKANQDRNQGGAARFTVYDACYPWNRHEDFFLKSLTLEAEVGGELFLRVNSPSRFRQRNGGVVKVQIKSVE
ncbi:MAG: ImmA/IrrE family metallo-endopeptidase [Thermoguttaceae bacterium]